MLTQLILAWTDDRMQAAQFKRCIGVPPDDSSVPAAELLAADHAGAIIVPVRLLARRAVTRRRLTA